MLDLRVPHSLEAVLSDLQLSQDASFEPPYNFLSNQHAIGRAFNKRTPSKILTVLIALWDQTKKTTHREVAITGGWKDELL